MPDLPLVVLAVTVWSYWIGVGIMIVRVRRRRRRLAGLVPEQRVERFMWLVWMPLVCAWVYLPTAALRHAHGLLALPPFAQPGSFYAPVRWIAAAVAMACLAATIDCWRRMGDDWRMDIGTRKTALVTDGLFRRIRHPIYAFSMLLMVCSALILPTPPMIAIALVHLALMNYKARNEERHLTVVHGDSYAQYVARTGRFFPRLSSR